LASPSSDDYSTVLLFPIPHDFQLVGKPQVIMETGWSWNRTAL